MANVGSLNLVLGADSTQLRQELGKVRQESQATALAITNLFSGDTINAVSFRLIRGTVMGLINDIDDLNNGLSITDSLTRNLAGSFQDMGDIALLQLGQIAQFLGDDLFQSPLQGLQSAALEDVGLGQLEGAFKIVSAGSNAVRILEVAIGGLTNGFYALDDILQSFQSQAQAVANFFKTIATNAQLVSSVIKQTANLIDGAIDSVLDSLQATYPAIGLLREGAKALGFEFSVGKSILGDYIDQLDRIDEAASTAANGAQDIADSTGKARKGLSGANETLQMFGSNLEEQRKAAAGFESAMKDLADAAVLFDKWKEISDAFDSVFGSLESNFQAANQMQALNNQLQLTSKAAGGAREDLQFLGKVTDDLGVDFNAAAAGYTQFSTAAALANLTTDQTKDIFESVTQATSVMGLSVADTQGVFLALQQILSSGNLQLEELNQIAERVPGAFQAAAGALNVTTGELKGLVSTGKVDSKTFLVGFAQQLKNFTDAGVVDAMDGGTAAVNRFNNALNQFQVQAGQAWLQVGTPALNTFADAISFAAKNEELFSSAIDAILAGSIPLFVTGMGKAAVATFQFIAANKTASITLFGQQIKFTAQELFKYAAAAGVAYAGLIVFYRTLDRVVDSAKSTREAIKSVDRALSELQESSDSKTLNLFPEKPPAADWLDAPITAMRDLQESSSLAEQGLGKFLEVLVAGPAALNRFVTFLKTGKFELTTFGEKAANDTLAAIGDFSGRVNEVLGEAFSQIDASKMGQGAIGEIKRIDAELARLKQQKLTVDPQDEDAVAAILQREEELYKQRSAAQEKVLKTQTAINTTLQQAKQELQGLDESKLGSEKYQNAKSQLEAMIAVLEKGKTQFDQVAVQAENAAQSISDSFEKTSVDIDQAFANQQAAIAESLAAGNISEEEARQQNLAAEQDYLKQRLTNNQSALKKLKDALEQDTQLRAVTPNSPGLLTPEQLKSYQDQVVQLESDTTQTRIDLANSVREGNKSALDGQLADIEAYNNIVIADAQIATNAQIAAVRKQQEQGLISAETAEQQIAAIKNQAAKDDIARIQNQLKQVDQLQAQGLINEKEAAQRKQEINQQLSEANINLIEGEIQAREQANRDAVQDFERASNAATSAIESSQQQRITAIKQAQLAGVVSEEEAQSQIDAIQQDGIAQTIAAKQDEITQVEALRAKGTLSAEEAADREAALTKEIGQLKLNQIDAELEAQRNARAEAIKGIEEESNARKSKLENRSGQLDLQAGSLNAEKDLLNARVELSSSLATLEQQRLSTQIAAAEASGNAEKAERLKVQQLQLQSQQIDRQYEAQKQQLAIDQQLKQIDLDRQKLSAQIAQIEAQAALGKAKAEGASQSELQSLQQVLNLRQQQVDAVDDAIAQQATMNQIQAQNLDVQYQISKEQQRQAEIQQEQIKNEGVIAALTDKSSKSRAEQAKQLEEIRKQSLEARNKGFITGEQFNQISGATRQIRSGLGSNPFQLAQTANRNQSNPFFAQILDSLGRSDVLGLSNLLNQNSLNSIRANSTGVTASSASSLLSGSGIPADSPLRNSGISGLTEASKAAMQSVNVANLGGIEKRLDAVTQILQSVGLRPNLTVSSQQPIADAAKVYADIATKSSNL